MYIVEVSDLFWHEEITPINGLPDISPESKGRQKINAVGCDRVIAARFLPQEEPEAERDVEWLMQHPRSDGRSPLFAWVPMAMVENISHEVLCF